MSRRWVTSAERVGELLGRQRPPRPVGEARGLVEVVAGDLLDQVDVAHRLAEAAHHGGDLGVEDRVRDQACLIFNNEAQITAMVCGFGEGGSYVNLVAAATPPTPPIRRRGCDIYLLLRGPRWSHAPWMQSSPPPRPIHSGLARHVQEVPRPRARRGGPCTSARATMPRSTPAQQSYQVRTPVLVVHSASALTGWRSTLEHSLKVNTYKVMCTSTKTAPAAFLMAPQCHKSSCASALAKQLQ